MAVISIREICKNSLIYNGHNTDVFNNKIPNQLIIIRNPIERFISSVISLFSIGLMNLT